MSNSPWTDDRVKALTARWDAGESISAIGRALCVTRNAVVSKAHRLGLAGRASPINRDQMPAGAGTTANLG